MLLFSELAAQLEKQRKRLAGLELGNEDDQFAQEILAAQDSITQLEAKLSDGNQSVATEGAASQANCARIHLMLDRHIAFMTKRETTFTTDNTFNLQIITITFAFCRAKLNRQGLFFRL